MPFLAAENETLGTRKGPGVEHGEWGRYEDLFSKKNKLTSSRCALSEPFNGLPYLPVASTGPLRLSAKAINAMPANGPANLHCNVEC